jgi:hypothetical protein
VEDTHGSRETCGQHGVGCEGKEKQRDAAGTTLLDNTDNEARREMGRRGESEQDAPWGITRGNEEEMESGQRRERMADFMEELFFGRFFGLLSFIAPLHAEKFEKVLEALASVASYWL